MPLVATLSGMSKGVFSVDWAEEEGVFVLAGGDAPVRVFRLVVPGGGAGWPPPSSEPLSLAQEGLKVSCAELP